VFGISTLMSPELAPAGTALGCGLHNRGAEFPSRQGCHILLFSKALDRLWGPSIGVGGSFPRVERPVREPDDSPFSAEIKNEWRCASTSPHEGSQGVNTPVTTHK
jgi:hypothetical protein